VYLGYVITENGVKPDPNKIKAVQAFPVPKDAKNIKQFLGLAGYYRRFISNFSKVAKPLTDLLKKDVEFQWKGEQKHSFERIMYTTAATISRLYSNIYYYHRRIRIRHRRNS
jgi:hypothetical protein